MRRIATLREVPLQSAVIVLRRVSEWLAATLEMWCPARGCGFESRALRSSKPLFFNGFCAQAPNGSRVAATCFRALSVQIGAERCQATRTERHHSWHPFDNLGA